MIVPPQIIMDTIPALENPTDKSVCITGHAEPNNESGNPKPMMINI